MTKLETPLFFSGSRSYICFQPCRMGQEEGTEKGKVAGAIARLTNMCIQCCVSPSGGITIETQRIGVLIFGLFFSLLQALVGGLGSVWARNAWRNATAVADSKRSRRSPLFTFAEQATKFHRARERQAAATRQRVAAGAHPSDG